MTTPRLEATRAQIVAYRRVVNGLDKRLPAGRASLRRAAWVGLTDSMPRAALHSIHARVEGTEPSTWEDPALVQIWGPRFSAYVIAAADAPIFTLGRLPDEGSGRRRAEETAARLHAFLSGRRMAYGEAGCGMGTGHNMLRYAAPTGTVHLRWDGARQPIIWTVPRPDMEPFEARLELARRHLHVFGPTTSSAFANWAGIKPPRAVAAFEALSGSLTAVRTPVGDAWILPDDEEVLRTAPAAPPNVARLLPSGDAFYLLQGAERALLVPEADHRPLLWTSRVWPGAVLVGGEIVGTWRRAVADVTIEPWRRLSPAEHEAVEAEAESLPLPGVTTPVRVNWVDANAPTR